jgi:hypothetical protein
MPRTSNSAGLPKHTCAYDELSQDVGSRMVEGAGADATKGLGTTVSKPDLVTATNSGLCACPDKCADIFR